jgi:hypothetical protein
MFSGGPNVGAFFGFVLVLGIIFYILSIVAAVKIVNKAGYSAAWVLVVFFVPFGFLMVYVFAFADWPVLQQARRGRPGPSQAPPAVPPAPTTPLPPPPPRWSPHR